MTSSKLRLGSGSRSWPTPRIIRRCGSWMAISWKSSRPWARPRAAPRAPNICGPSSRTSKPPALSPTQLSAPISRPAWHPPPQSETTTMADAAILKELAPNGKLRLAIAVAPSPSAQFAIKDGDSYRGVAVTFRRALAATLGGALAARLGVPLEIIPHQASGEIQNSAAANRWDVAFLPVDEERKKFVDFGNAYHLLQSTFLVAPGSKIQSVKDADAKGVGIGGVSNTATFRAAKKATANATHIDFAGVDAAVAAMRDSKIEAIALSRESLSGLVGKIAGSRILDDAFLNSSTAVCVPKGKPAALGYVSDFIEEAKASGL